MTNKERRNAETALIYEKEFALLEQAKNIQNQSPASQEALAEQFSQLTDEYERLLKRTVKITRVGDSNQRKLLAANELIEQQKDELSLAYQQLDLISREDPLTKLSNRRDFIEKFQDEIHRFERKRGSFSIIMGDIDDFKQVNDRYGHDCGDFVLVKIAELMRSAVRKLDCIARWGGEEFILMLPGTQTEGAIKVAEDIRKQIETSCFQFKQFNLSITITFGICPFQRGMDMNTCIAKADKALYQGKRQGKNQVIPAKLKKLPQSADKK